MRHCEAMFASCQMSREVETEASFVKSEGGCVQVSSQNSEARSSTRYGRREQQQHTHAHTHTHTHTKKNKATAKEKSGTSCEDLRTHNSE